MTWEFWPHGTKVSLCGKVNAVVVGIALGENGSVCYEVAYVEGFIASYNLNSF